MNGVASFVRFIDSINRVIGKPSAWLMVACVLVCASVAILRYFFNFGQIWMQELYVALFAASFMLVSGYVYVCNQHVRVDIVSGKFSEKARAWVEIFGVLVFLTPWLLLLIVTSLWDQTSFVRTAWALREGSPLPGGLQGYYLLKSLIPVFAIMMLAQGLAAIGRAILILNNRKDLLPPRENLVPTSEGAAH